MKYQPRFSWLGGILFVVLVFFVSACSSPSNITATIHTTNTPPGQSTTPAASTSNLSLTSNSSSTSNPSSTSSSSSTSNPSSTSSSSTTALQTLPLTQIRMTDATHGWALDKNNILKTSDGGQSWVALTPNGAIIGPDTQADFLNASDAWFTMPNTNVNTFTVFYTTTGGATWKASIINEPDPMGGLLNFISSQTGWLMVSRGGPGAGSEPVDIFRTDDGGAIWNKVSSSGQGQNSLPNGGIKSGLSFLNAETGWVTGEDASNTPWLYMTHNGGKTWYQESIAGLPSNSIGSQTFPPLVLGNNGYLPMTITTSTPQTVLVRSTDGGADWTISGQQLASFQASNMYVVNTRTAFATDNNSGDVYQTMNGGQTWQKIASNTGVYGPLSFINTTTGFGLGRANQTVLERTDNGGRTWQTISYQIHN